MLPDIQPNYLSLYTFVLTPVGHKGTQAFYFHDFEGKYPPVPRCVHTQLNFVTYNFNASGSYDPDGYIVSYVWHWSDGTTSTGVSVTRSFSNPEAINVSLVVTDNDGLEGMLIINIGIW